MCLLFTAFNHDCVYTKVVSTRIGSAHAMVRGCMAGLTMQLLYKCVIGSAHAMVRGCLTMQLFYKCVIASKLN